MNIIKKKWKTVVFIAALCGVLTSCGEVNSSISKANNGRYSFEDEIGRHCTVVTADNGGIAIDCDWSRK